MSPVLPFGLGGEGRTPRPADDATRPRRRAGPSLPTPTAHPDRPRKARPAMPLAHVAERRLGAARRRPVSVHDIAGCCVWFIPWANFRPISLSLTQGILLQNILERSRGYFLHLSLICLALLLLLSDTILAKRSRPVPVIVTSRSAVLACADRVRGRLHHLY